MSDFRIKAQKTGPRSFLKELQMISYRGGALYTESGSPLIAEKEVYYPPDYLASKATAIVLDPESFESDGLSLRNNFRKGRPAALPIEEQFKEGSAVSRSLLGIDRAETQQGLFGNVSSYGLDRKDWVAYASYPDSDQGGSWSRKNSPAGPHVPTQETDDAKNSSIYLSTYPVPYTNPGNAPVGRALNSGAFSGQAPVGWAKYIQSLVAMYLIEYMVNNFTTDQKQKFRLEYLEDNYPKQSDGTFDRLYWDRIWIDINQSRVGRDGNIPVLPFGEFRNFGALSETKNGVIDPDYKKLDLTDTSIYGVDGASQYADLSEVSNYYGNFFSASTRYVWTEPDKGHYRLKTNTDPEVWSEYWGMDYANLPQDLKDWEFRVLESEPDSSSPEVKYGLPYYLIQDSDNPSDSLILGASWPKTYSDLTIPQLSSKLTEGNIIGSRPSRYAIQTLQSTRAFRYQPGRISGFTYGVRVSEEGAGPGTTLEFGVENYSDGYFFRLKDGTDFSIIRRSTVSLGVTDFFIRAGYQEREAFVNRLTGRASYKDVLSATEIAAFEEDVREGNSYLVYETAIEQNKMNGDGLNNQGPSGYIYNPDTVTMYKIEFGWYGAIGARFYAYIPQDKGEARWVTLHTLVIENQIGQPCLQDPYFFFKYRVWTEEPAAIRIPQFVEKYGASYYIDGGDEGTVSIGSGSASNRTVQDAVVADYASEGISFPISKWATVLGLKTRKTIVNSEGNEFFNKKELYPVSMSVISTKNVEIKFVNQYGCQEHAHTFQEGFRCILPESQRLRGKFLIKSLESDEDNLADINRAENPVPTITWLDSATNDTTYNLQVGNSSSGAFIGWDGLNRGLLGTKIIADKVYQAYVNPKENVNNIDPSKVTTILARNTNDEQFYSTFKDYKGWSDGRLLFRYPSTGVDAKLSSFRKDTTLVSTIGIESEEFYLLFTSTRSGGGYDTYEEAQTSANYNAICNGGGRCDGNHAADMQIGIVWPYGNTSDTYNSEGYPKYHTHVNRVGDNFGVLMPNDTDAQAYTSWGSKNAELVEDTVNSDFYVRDKQIPDSDNFRYYEGLPVDFEDNAFADNTIVTSSTGYVNVSNALEVGESLGLDLGTINNQLPGVPGEDGGSCRGIFVKAGLIEELGKFIIDDSSNLFLSKSSPWDSGLSGVSTTLFAEDANFTVNTYNTTGGDQQEFVIPGTAITEYWLPVTVATGSSAFPDNEEITIKYRAIALYQPSLLSDTATLLQRKITGSAPFPLKFFIKMREGGEIGSVVIAKKTSKGLITVPFTPHGCSVSQSDTGTPDSHNGGANNTSKGAIKTMGIFSHPGALNPALSYSYLDTRTDIDNPTDRSKKCYSFLSRNTLEGAGFSGTGDYPLRFLKFKDSGDPVGAFYISANKPEEISLKEIFNYNGESVTPSFWSNKALFMIARDIGTVTGGGDPDPGNPGKVSVTLNYKEQ